MNKILRDNLLRFAILVPVQILILNYVHLFGFLNPYLYLMALLLLPFNMPKSLQYVIDFATGLIIDIFSMSYGIHASASTLIIFLRPFFLRMLDGTRATELGNAPLPGIKSFSWIVTYTAVLVFIHHFTVTMLEVFTFHNFWRHFGSAVANTIFTSFCIICLEYIFLPAKNQRAN